MCHAELANPLPFYTFTCAHGRVDTLRYFIEPCNAVSNGFFLSTFNSPVLSSKNNCGTVSEGFAMDCIDEDHLLQVVTGAMPFGSWFMHGSGGFSLGGFLGGKGMDVQVYFMYRLMLKEYVTDVNVRSFLRACTDARTCMHGRTPAACTPARRKALSFGHACNAKNVPDESDGIKWVDSNGERLCHLYWARQIKKLLTNSTLIQDYTNRGYAEGLLKGAVLFFLGKAAVRAALLGRRPRLQYCLGGTRGCGGKARGTCI